MIAAGIDIGSTTSKAVIMDGDRVVAAVVTPTGVAPAETAERVFSDAARIAGIGKETITLVATTGYGRRLTGFSSLVITEIKACAAGCFFLGTPDGKPMTLIDVGGQDTKIIQMNGDGGVANFAMNDKCAAGTGRFLEVLAQKLELSYSDFVGSALLSKSKIQMNSTCAVFAESEVVSLLTKGCDKSDIAAAAHRSIANRIVAMLRRTGTTGAPYMFVGGGALNGALIAAVEECLGMKIHGSPHAQIATAIGAAITAGAASR